MKSMAKVVVAVVALVVTGPSAWASLSGSSTSTSGASCSGGGSADGDCRNSVSVITNNANTYKTRYAWNINADTGVGSTHDTSSSASHHVDFTVNAPGSYQLSISTSRSGDINKVNDLSGCSGSADTTGVTGSSNVALASGTLSLADPGGFGNNGNTQESAISQSTPAVIGPRF